MKTKRIQTNQIMCESEKKDFSKIIRTMPWLYSPILEELKGKKGETLCDVACGDGYLLELIHERFPDLRLKGVDIDSYFIRRAKKELPFGFERLDVFKLKEKFDIITLNLALHHFDNALELVLFLKSKCRVLIISDQVRPSSEKELKERLEKRRLKVGGEDTEYYIKNERDSILEAYSEEEVRGIFSGIDCELKFVDEDYYKRFVCVFGREGKNFIS